MAPQPPDKSTFLNKLAKFVANPTTEWSQLDALTSETPEPTQMPQAELGHAELMRLQRARRKHDRRVRTREFALLRKIQVSRQPEVQVQDFQSTLLNRLSIPKSEAMSVAHVPPNERMFKITEINRIEQQMADQWWSDSGTNSDHGTHVDLPLEANEVPTQILINTQFGHPLDPPAKTETAPPADESMIAFSDMLEFTPSILAGANVEEPTPEPTPVIPTLTVQASPTPAPTNIPTSKPLTAAAPTTPRVYQYHTPEASVAPDSLILENSTSSPRAHQVNTNDALTPDTMTHHGFDINTGAAHHNVRLVQELPDALNEPAILFAQGKHTEAEQALQQLLAHTQSHTTGHEDEIIDIRLALLDLYRCLRDEENFDHAALDLIQRSGRSPPQYWHDVSTPVAHSSHMTSRFAPDTLNGAQHWVCPAELDMMAVLLLRSQLMRTTPEILLDWRPLQHIDDAALQPLLAQLRELAERRVELIMWGASRLLQHVASLSQTAITTDERDLCWQLRLELVRIMYRQEDFDALALEYCLDFEVSPPPWTAAHATYIDAEADDILAADPTIAARTEKEESNTSNRTQAAGSMRNPQMWVGDVLGQQKALFDAAIASAIEEPVCEIDCIALDRMDYTASADLLAWLAQRTSDSKPIRFVNVHRLLAVFWRVMGVTAQAKVELRKD